MDYSYGRQCLYRVVFSSLEACCPATEAELKMERERPRPFLVVDDVPAPVNDYYEGEVVSRKI